MFLAKLLHRRPQPELSAEDEPAGIAFADAAPASQDATHASRVASRPLPRPGRAIVLAMQDRLDRLFDGMQ